MRRGIDRSRRGGVVVLGLVLLATVQVGAIVVSMRRRDPPPVVRQPDLLIGAIIATIRGHDSLGRLATVSLRRTDPSWTVLLAFSPTCSWCDSVAPRWRSWTNEVNHRVRVVGVVSGSPSAALAYTHRHAWQLQDLLAVDSTVTGTLERQLTRKTPWLFLFDSAGVLRYSGHGNEVGVVDSLVGLAR